ncbi:MAG TPA: hypothetical protein V6D47_01255 [Oscillatoriaceae cyanobacterium]
MAIEVPYQGDVPQPHFFRLTPSHFYYDWGPARCKAGRPQENRLSGVVQRFALANRPGGDVRLAVQTASAAVPLLEIDRRSQELIVYPTGKRTMLGAHPVPHSSAPSQQAVLPPPPVIPSPSSDDWSEPLRFFAHPVAVKPPEHLAPPTRRNALLTMLGKPVLDDFHHRLVLAYQGEPPAYAMQAYAKNPRWVYFDFPNTSFPLEGARFDSYTDRVFEGWLLSQRQGGLRTRLYLKLTQAMPVQAKVFPASHEIWLTASVPSPSPSPSPTPVLAPLSLPASAASTPLATSTVVPSTAPR